MTDEQMTSAEATIEFHPIANCWRLMDEDEFKALCDDIEANGLLEDIVRFEGKVLDGRNRYNACIKVGTEPRFTDWNGECGTPKAFVISMNLARRHLTTSQRAMVAADLVTLDHGGDRKSENQDANLHLDPVTQKEAAKLVNVSTRSVADAFKVKRGGSNELVEAVNTGDVSVSQAAKIAAKPAAEQKKEVKQIVAGVRTKRGPKPKPNEKPTGPFAKAEKLIGQLAREIDVLAKQFGGPSVRSRDLHVRLNEFNHKVLEWKQAAR